MGINTSVLAAITEAGEPLEKKSFIVTCILQLP